MKIETLQIKSKRRLLMLLFFSGVLLHGIIASNLGEYTVLIDEHLHAMIAKGLAQGRGIFYRGALLSYYEILYSLVISPAFLIAPSAEIAHIIVMWINAMLMSSAVFPAYLLARKYLQQQRYIWLIAGLSILIGEMSYTRHVIQENLNYPLMLWAFLAFSHIVIEARNRPRNICFLSLLMFILSTCKQMSLIFFVGSCIYWIWDILLDRIHFYENLRNFALYFSFFTCFYSIYHAICKTLMKNAIEVPYSPLEFIMSQKIGTIAHLVYPGFVYILVTIFATGIFPIPVLIGNYSILSVREKKLGLLLATYVMVAIGMICLLIVPLENLGDISIRIHMRYYFYAFIPLMILFLRIYEQTHEKSINNIVTSAILTSVAILVAILPLFPTTGSIIDSINARAFGVPMKDEVFAQTEKIVLVLVIMLGVILMAKSKKAVYCLCSGILVTTMLIGSVVNGKVNLHAKQLSVPAREDAQKINDFLFENGDDSGNGQDVLLIGKTDISFTGLEDYLNSANRYVTLENIFAIWKKGSLNFEVLPYSSFNTVWNDETGKPPKYIISEVWGIELQGYEKVDIGLTTGTLYKHGEGEIGFKFITTGVHGDYWIDPPTELNLVGSAGCTRATLSVTVRNPLLPEGVDVTYTDGCGNSGVFTIPYSTDWNTDLQIEIPVYKRTEENRYSMTLIPKQSTRVGEDNRNLSFQMLNANLISEQ